MPSSNRFVGEAGNVAIMFALLLPLICLAAGGALDFQRRHEQESRLQAFADTLALRGAREFLLANADARQIEALVEAVAASELASRYGVGAFSLDVRVNARARDVTVALSEAPKSALMATFAPSFRDHVGVDATATASGGANVCVIALDSSGAGAVDAAWNSRLDAGECALLSNSTSSTGVQASGSSKLIGSLICSAGGYFGPSGAFEPSVTTDCPVTEDPLETREPPAIGGCDHQDKMVGDRNSETFKAALEASFGEMKQGAPEMARQDHTLDPGVYCGGLAIGSNASVTFNPGVYVIKDGPFVVDLNGRIAGDGVGFYMSGDDATFLFSPDSKIDLSAPKDGLLAGILFFEDRRAPAGRTHSILSNDARTLLGTFYLPQSTLLVSTISPVADQSAYTAIVARRLKMMGSPTLVLNTDYGLTDVPTPDGVGPVGGEVFLRD
ncbi:MAG: TadE/TadG family type IV pilus assembly protein [Parvularculaceae bacterium]